MNMNEQGLCMHSQRLLIAGRPLDIKGQWIKRHVKSNYRKNFPIEVACARFADASMVSFTYFWFTSNAATYRLPDVAHKELRQQ